MEGHIKRPKIDAGTESRIITLENRKVYYETYERITTGTGGTLTVATEATILLDRYEDAGDCLVLKTDSSGRPIDEIARTATGAVITSTLDISGNYIFSGEPSAYPVAIVYQIEIPAKYSENVSKDKIVEVVNRLRLEETEYSNSSSGVNANNGQDAIDFVYSNHINHKNNSSNPHGVTKSQIGLGNVANTDTSNPANIIWTTLYRTVTENERMAIAHSNRGALDLVSGTNTGDETTSTILTKIGDGSKINQTYLPSYVDDVLEYTNSGLFPATGETGKIYVDTTTNLTYRWSGTVYVEISKSLALGTTSSTAYRGDYGNTAYTHSQVVTGNPHGTTKTDLSLGNVPNLDTSTTANITDSLDKRFVTDAQRTSITHSNRTALDNVSGTNTGDETTTTMGILLNNATEKTTCVDADIFSIRDSVGGLLKKMSWANIKLALKAFFGAVHIFTTNTIPTAAGTNEVAVYSKSDERIYRKGNKDATEYALAEDFKTGRQIPSVFLNGTNAYISVADNSNINFGTGTFSIITEQLFESGSTTRYKIHKFSGAVGFYLSHAISNKVAVFVTDGTNSWSITSTLAITDGNAHKIGFIFGIDSASSKIVIDGIEDTTATKSGTFPTLTKTNTTALSIGSVSENYHKNEVRNTQLYNYALTVENCRKYMYESLPYREIGASNTDLTAGNGSFATNTTAWWNKNGGTLTWNAETTDATFVSDGTQNSNFTYIGKNILSMGKRYRLSLKAKSSNYNGAISFYAGAGTSILSTNTVTSDYTTFTFEFIPTQANLFILLFISDATNGKSITVDDIIVQQIGCVLDLSPDSIANTGWFDKSGNNLHATYTSALPFNLQNYKPRIQGYSADMRGANVASATTITPTGELFHVTGTTAIATINVPYSTFNGSITIIPDAVFAWNTAGNIALPGTSVVGKALTMTYDATTAKWYPSYTT